MSGWSVNLTILFLRVGFDLLSGYQYFVHILESAEGEMKVMWPDRVSNPGPLTYESGALPTALRGPAAKLLV